jgi:hypothetical protein
VNQCASVAGCVFYCFCLSLNKMVVTTIKMEKRHYSDCVNSYVDSLQQHQYVSMHNKDGEANFMLLFWLPFRDEGNFWYCMYAACRVM